MATQVAVLCALLACVCARAETSDLDRVVFPSDAAERSDRTSVSPSAGSRPRQHFSIQPNGDGGFSASASLSNNFASSAQGGGLSASQAASQSHALNFQVGKGGFSASQAASASQASSYNTNFGNLGSSLSSSHASSQSSSFSGGAGYGGSGSASSSQSASGSFSSGGGGGAASLSSGSANSQSWAPPGYSLGGGGASSQAASAGFSGGATGNRSPNHISPDFIRIRGRRPQNSRYDGRGRPVLNSLYNQLFNPFARVNTRDSRRG